MNKQKFLGYQWRQRKKRVRKKIFGHAERPRLSVFRSARHMYAQIVDDTQGTTLVSASTVGKDMDGSDAGGNCEAAKKVGLALAKKATSVGIRQVNFDRNGYRYHGRVKALADAAREGGLVF